MMMLQFPRVLIAGNAGSLAAIRDPDISIAIWERTVQPAFAGLLSSRLLPIQMTSDIGDLAAALTHATQAAGYPAGGIRAALEADIVDLASRFASIMRIDRLDIRLDRITGDACRKFHADYVLARLITTYAGRGTQWLDGESAGNCDCAAPHDVREMRAGDVAILKGRNWDEERAAIHRSPPIAGTGEERLLLTISPERPAN
ncbi:DUF1826 domain-containing protein [Sphingopyxis sp. JAI128]|uniref:DUF1826 domain-containing protein n=1 Tax=Sphingopyxis sp. JAI128 TaxID=2723066 RepID=UPI001621E369|nr:DUF1826 domain-containing protein [Sphingopyxis sp. JAI128]MBB6425306.1 hypothetical protein [Sphingopyxis sp. JAI128]